MDPNSPYNLWTTRKSLGVMREVKTMLTYWLDLCFPSVFTSTEEWIDFEKIPAISRRIAPFVRPLNPGHPIWEAAQKATRFKPAYTKLRDTVDPLMPLIKTPGVDGSILNESDLTPMQRLELIKVMMTQQQVAAITRLWEWMAAKAIIDGKVMVKGDDYPAVEVDFGRAANQTQVKSAGTFWGDSGVAIFDDFQRYCDIMFEAEFGGFPTRATVGANVWKVMRQDPNFMKHMDTQIRDPRATMDRSLVMGGEKAIKVGELTVGGNSGAIIEIWQYRETFTNASGAQELFMGANDIVLTSSAEAVSGVRCYGAIVDRRAQYQAIPIFPKNWVEGNDPEVEVIGHSSAPLMVPINPNATFKATVVGG